MSSPDYSKYTLDELYEALSTIDRDAYSNRIKIIEEEISKHKRDKPSIKKDEISKEKSEAANIHYQNYLLIFEKGRIFLYIISFIFGLSLFLNLVFGFRISEFGTGVEMVFPGSESLSNKAAKIIISIVFYSIYAGFIISSIGSYLNKNLFKMLLAFIWGILAIGIHIWIFKWWPSVHFDFHFNFSFNIQGIILGFKLNLITTFFFLWSVILIPELKKEIHK